MIIYKYAIFSFYYHYISKYDCALYMISREIEETTPYKCAVIYGQLPPETRSTQARLFNEDNTGFDILVASDAIGMGLNLNIRRIIFHTTLKVRFVLEEEQRLD